MATYQYTPMPAVEGPQVMSIADMINTARGAQALKINEQAYQQAERINPLTVQKTQEDVKQSQIKTDVDRFAFQQRKFQEIANSQIPMINNPLILAAEENPQSVNKDDLKKLIMQNGLSIAKSQGIKEDEAYQLLQPYMQMADQNPAGLRQFYKERLLRAADESTKIQALQPSGTPVRTGAVEYQVQKGEFGAVPPGYVLPGTYAPQQLGPGERMKATGQVDVNNNPIYDVMDSYGRVIGQTTVPSTVPPNQLPGPPTAQPSAGQMRQQLAPAPAAPAVPAAPGITRIPAGQTAESGKAYLTEANESRQAVPSAKVGLQNIDTVLKYLPLAETGRLSDARAGLQSILGNVANSKPDELAAAARDIIAKTIEDLALQKNAALGGKFASSLEAAKSSLASPERNPTAIIKSMEQLRPLLKNIENYSAGLDKAIEKSPVKQYVKPEFDAAFNEAFDMKALLFKNAYEQGKDLRKYAKENNISVVEQEKLLNKIQAYDYLANGDLAAYKAFIANLNRGR